MKKTTFQQLPFLRSFLFTLLLMSGFSSGAHAVPTGCGEPDAFSKAATECPAPGVPSSFSVPSSDSDGSYTISWGIAAYSPSRYELYEKTGSSSSWSRIHNSSSRSKTVAGKSNGQYSYRVRACNGYGCGNYTSIKTVQVTIPLSSPPGIPTSLTVPSTDDDGNYTVSWGFASGSPTRYELYESVGSSSWNRIYSGLNRSVGITGRGGSVYSYKVRACNSQGCGGYTSTKSVNVSCAVDENGDCQPFLAEIDLLTLNTWLIPTPLGISDGPYRVPRAKALTHLLKNIYDYDVVALQETFDEQASAHIFQGLEQKYPEQVHHLPEDIGIEKNGGLSLLSKFSSVYHHNEPFSECAGVTDCIAQKGFTYNRLLLPNGIIVAIVNTHLNAGDTEDCISARESQLQQISLWVAENHPRDIPIIYVGDFNIHGTNGIDSGSWEYSNLTENLGNSSRDAWLESYGDSLALNSDCGANFADPGYTHYSNSIAASLYTNFSGICPRNESDPGSDPNQRFDYIFVDDGASPFHVEISGVKTTRWSAWVCFDELGRQYWCGEGGTFVGMLEMDMSDHFGLAARIRVYPATVARPVAGFGVSQAGLAATFTDTSASSRSIVSWHWRFGDDSVSTSQHPSHTYGAGGTYTVHLTVRDTDGLSDTYSRTVTVAPPLSVGSILGPSEVAPGASNTWSISVSGGKAPYFFQWYKTQECLARRPGIFCGWSPVGGNSPSLTTSLSGNSTLKVTVTDYNEVSFTKTKRVTVE